jgi:hypothetical protein
MVTKKILLIYLLLVPKLVINPFIRQNFRLEKYGNKVKKRLEWDFLNSQ